ncbi:MAG: M57 family metalloprotease, partial [Bacteroidota bacterium]
MRPNGAGTSLRLRRVLQRPLCNGGTFCGITIFRAPGVGSCGAAEFPNNLGHPGATIYLDEEALSPFDPFEGFNWRELITHELGHTVGLRHTNWHSVREAANPNGVPTHIPGTPTLDHSSIMNHHVGCQSGGRGLSTADKDALRALYGGGIIISPNLYFYYPANMPVWGGKKSNVLTLLGGRALRPVSPRFHSANSLRPVSYQVD